MTNEEMVLELRDLLDCNNFKHVRDDIEALIKKIQPKPTMIDDIELLEKKIFRGHGDKDIYHAWMRLRVELRRTKYEPEEKVYGPQKCNETVKTCENCRHNLERFTCQYCSKMDKWEPILTNGKLWKEVKAIEEAHKDAADSKCNFGDKFEVCRICGGEVDSNHGSVCSDCDQDYYED